MFYKFFDHKRAKSMHFYSKTALLYATYDAISCYHSNGLLSKIFTKMCLKDEQTATINDLEKNWRKTSRGAVASTPLVCPRVKKRYNVTLVFVVYIVVQFYS